MTGLLFPNFLPVSAGKDMESQTVTSTQSTPICAVHHCLQMGTSYFLSVINRRMCDFVLVSVVGECILYKMFENSLCHVFVTTCVHCKDISRVYINLFSCQVSSTTWTQQSVNLNYVCTQNLCNFVPIFFFFLKHYHHSVTSATLKLNFHFFSAVKSINQY